MIESDGIDDVTVLVNSSPSKLMGANFNYANGFSSFSNAVLCAKASMLLQVRRLIHARLILGDLESISFLGRHIITGRLALYRIRISWAKFLDS